MDEDILDLSSLQQRELLEVASDFDAYIADDMIEALESAPGLEFLDIAQLSKRDEYLELLRLKRAIYTLRDFTRERDFSQFTLDDVAIWALARATVVRKWIHIESSTLFSSLEETRMCVMEILCTLQNGHLIEKVSKDTYQMTEHWGPVIQ